MELTVSPEATKGKFHSISVILWRKQKRKKKTKLEEKKTESPRRMTDWGPIPFPFFIPFSQSLFLPGKMYTRESQMQVPPSTTAHQRSVVD
ncbi:hypothetical protein B9Z55_022742 [Caenorhabditis nigoni]|uniref:Uncharacterized protein n=1 Tax=Caenorhabditis nigoni TaxID=1611254 RepID=A0A2G5SM62_9PELO|nr:hypothetical protein B9Z55_022742 [Caenorhabditis nigoni]